MYYKITMSFFVVETNSGWLKAGSSVGKHFPKLSQPDLDQAAKTFIVGHSAGLNGGVIKSSVSAKM